VPTPVSTKTLLILIFISCVSLASTDASSERDGVSGNGNEANSSSVAETAAAAEAATPLPMKRLDPSAQKELRKAIRANEQPGTPSASGGETHDSRACTDP
jgi:hypothetical protein